MRVPFINDGYLKKSVAIGLLLPIALLISALVGTRGIDGFTIMVGVLIGVIVSILVAIRPYFGIVLLISAVPLEQLYPNIPLGTSILTFVGAITMLSHSFHNGFRFHNFRRQAPFLFGLAFGFWLVITNPAAAMLPSPTGRIYLFTYAQLLILLVLAAELMTAKRQRLLMAFWVIISCISAAASVGDVLRSSISLRNRAAAFFGNANGLALFLVMAIPMALHLRQRLPKARSWNRLFPFVFVLLVLGIVASLSRAGLAALAATFAFLFLYAEVLGGDSERDVRKVAMVLIPIALLLIPSSYWGTLQSSLESVNLHFSGTGYVDPRVGLWEAALEAAFEHPVTGVGVGQYRQVNEAYLDPIFVHRAGVGAHNTFLAVLAETGAVGLSLFFLWIGAVFRRLWSTMRQSKNGESASLAAVWLIVLVQICIVGFTHSLQYNKLLWFVAGISVALSTSVKVQPEPGDTVQ